uniref:EF-hand domain pair, mitogen-activated protein (MAP) kinase n=1 Tax=Tanacetum cinerariifolium TaxID=118510 RepID=A0A6L2K2L3_TANCI|nr:EF-hand domain pair, mitogen-activated protein (MAP) kinase [Tanacetum cinerariifolium]
MGTIERLFKDLESAYDNTPNMLSIQIHNGGNFQRNPGRIPLTSLDEGLYALAFEEDVHCLATLVRSFKLNAVYIEHSVTDLDSYIRPPRFRATIEEITDELGSIALVEHRSEKMLLLTWYDASKLTKEPVYESVTQLDREAGFADVAESGVESSSLSHDESFGVDNLDLNLNEHVNLNVSLGEDVKQDNGKFFYDDEGIDTAYDTEYDVQSSEDACTNDDDDKDEDFLIDEENEIVEPGVDVHLFGISMDVLFDIIGVTNVVPDEVLEGENMDVINADGFDREPGNDNETSNYRRRRLAELSREIEGVINASGQWKYSIYTGKKFTTTKEAKDRLYLYSIESRLNLKLYKNDSVRIRARCDEKVPLFTMSQGGNNKEASGSASRQEQQTAPAVSQDVSGGSGVGVVIVSDNGKFPTVDEEDSPSDSLPTIVITKNKSAVSGNGKFLMVDEKDLIFKKISPMAEEIMEKRRKHYEVSKPLLRHYGILPIFSIISYFTELGSLKNTNRTWYYPNGLHNTIIILIVLRCKHGLGGGGGYLRDYVRVVAGMDDEEMISEAVEQGMDDHVPDEIDGAKCEQLLNHAVKKEMISEAVEQGMDDHVPDEIDGAKCEQLPNHAVKKGNLEFLVCKQIENNGGDKLVEKRRPLKRKSVYAE